MENVKKKLPQQKEKQNRIFTHSSPPKGRKDCLLILLVTILKDIKILFFRNNMIDFIRFSLQCF